MIIEKNGTAYTVTESSDKWTVKAESGQALGCFCCFKNPFYKGVEV